MRRLTKEFYQRPCLDVARELVGKWLVHETPQGELRLRISETEAYCGESDTACHAHRGRTPRTEVLYMEGGTIYVYLCYGIHWLLNIVTGEADQPEAVLIRACEGAPGPGRLTKALKITGALNCADVTASELRIETDDVPVEVTTAPRVGINYASPEDIARPWRFILKDGG